MFRRLRPLSGIIRTIFFSGMSSIKFTNVLSQSDFSDSDLSLLSWLQSIPRYSSAMIFLILNLKMGVFYCGQHLFSVTHSPARSSSVA